MHGAGCRCGHASAANTYACHCPQHPLDHEASPLPYGLSVAYLPGEFPWPSLPSVPSSSRPTLLLSTPAAVSCMPCIEPPHLLRRPEQASCQRLQQPLRVPGEAPEQVAVDRARGGGEGADATPLQPPLQLEGEAHVGQLGAGVLWKPAPDGSQHWCRDRGRGRGWGAGQGQGQSQGWLIVRGKGRVRGRVRGGSL